MILCLACRRLWPKESVYCGNCGKSLGKRYCPELHENTLQARACTTCGLRKLTPGTRAISLRPLSCLLAPLILLAAWHFVAVPVGGAIWHGAQCLFWAVASPLLNVLITLAFWSFVLSLFVGDKGRAMIGSFWSGVLRIFLTALGSLAKYAFAWLPKPDKKESRT